MLRPAIQIAFWLSAGFLLLGVLIARRWGWSEYASDDLYVVYYQGSDSAKQFFIVKADGSEEGEALTSPDGTLTALACSPDGRTLAFVTAAPHLYVATRAGVSYDLPLKTSYNDASAANSGWVTLSQVHSKGNKLLVRPNGTASLDAPADAEFSAPKIASSGLTLWALPWTTHNYGTLAVSADGTSLQFAPGLLAPEWLATEATFRAMDYASTNDHQYLFDLTTREAYPLPAPGLLLSPDGMKAVDWAGFNHAENTRVTTQLFIYDFLVPHPAQIVLTHYVDVSSFPLCFLTFRPGMLTAHSP